jgi:hypothetical protein
VAPALQGRSAAVATLLDGNPVTVFTALDVVALEAGMRQLVGHGARARSRCGPSRPRTRPSPPARYATA